MASLWDYIELLMIGHCAGASTNVERLQDWLHSGDEFPIAFKVNYISEDLLPVTVTSR